jgi:hypothetical protein
MVSEGSYGARLSAPITKTSRSALRHIEGEEGHHRRGMAQSGEDSPV